MPHPMAKASSGITVHLGYRSVLTLRNLISREIEVLQELGEETSHLEELDEILSEADPQRASPQPGSSGEST